MIRRMWLLAAAGLALAALMAAVPGAEACLTRDQVALENGPGKCLFIYDQKVYWCRGGCPLKTGTGGQPYHKDNDAHHYCGADVTGFMKSSHKQDPSKYLNPYFYQDLCAACLPTCAGERCGQADGCGGACPAADRAACGRCGNPPCCAPQCAGEQCGQADGCGGRCPAADAATCGKCGNPPCPGPCQPRCTSELCGQPDGCGGTCPTTDAQVCGRCNNPPCCTPDCAGHFCGQADGCGGACPAADRAACGRCGNPPCPGTCVPDCSRGACGQADGCGGTCPSTDAQACGKCANPPCPTAPNGTEACDGADNDADGRIDEGIYEVCGTTDEGACRLGVRLCEGGQLGATCYNNIEPSLEVCGNIVDEDCDGRVASCDPCRGASVPFTGCGCGSLTAYSGFCCDGRVQARPCNLDFPVVLRTVNASSVVEGASVAVTLTATSRTPSTWLLEEQIPEGWQLEDTDGQVVGPQVRWALPAMATGTVRYALRAPYRLGHARFEGRFSTMELPSPQPITGVEAVTVAGSLADTDGDAVVDEVDACGGTPLGAETNLRGCLLPRATAFDAALSTNFRLEQDLRAAPLVLTRAEIGQVRAARANVEGVNLDEAVRIAYNAIEVDPGLLALEGPVELALYNLPFESPKILRDGVDCPAPDCRILAYQDGALSFAVQGFSTYSATEKAFCGDRACGAKENCASCAADCACQAGFACQNGACVAVAQCGDGVCVAGETCAACPNDCGACLACEERWDCTDWTPCALEGVSTRSCTEMNQCGTARLRPTERRTCLADEMPRVTSKTVAVAGFVILGALFVVGLALLARSRGAPPPGGRSRPPSGAP